MKPCKIMKSPSEDMTICGGAFHTANARFPLDTDIKLISISQM